MDKKYIDINEIAKSVCDEYGDDYLNNLTFKLKSIVDKQNRLSYQWLSNDVIIEALRLMLSICCKSNIDLNAYIKCSIKE